MFWSNIEIEGRCDLINLHAWYVNVEHSCCMRPNSCDAILSEVIKTINQRVMHISCVFFSCSFNFNCSAACCNGKCKEDKFCEIEKDMLEQNWTKKKWETFEYNRSDKLESDCIVTFLLDCGSSLSSGLYPRLCVSLSLSISLPLLSPFALYSMFPMLWSFHRILILKILNDREKDLYEHMCVCMCVNGGVLPIWWHLSYPNEYVIVNWFDQFASVYAFFMARIGSSINAIAIPYAKKRSNRFIVLCIHCRTVFTSRPLCPCFSCTKIEVEK